MKIVIFPVLILLLMVIGCTTSKGTLFTDIVEQEETEGKSKPKEGKTGTSKTSKSAPTVAETDPIEREDIEEGEEAGLYIRTSPEYADIYVNGTYYGESPLLIQDLDNGSYRLTIVYPGYYPEEVWVTLEKDTRVELDFSLQVITGKLSIAVDQEGTTVLIDGTSLGPGIHELPIGTHSVRVRKFGFEDFTETVSIAENKTVYVNVSLSEAEFRVTDLTSSKSVLNPENPGKLGVVDISFTVSSYGDGLLSVIDNQDETVFSTSVPDFTTWDQSFSWDGSSASGSPLPDGVYTIRVVGTDQYGDSLSTVTTAIEINREAVIRYRGLTSGASGFMYAVTPEVLPKNSFQVSFLTLGHIDPTVTPATYRFPLHLGLRYSPVKNLEIDAQGTPFLQSGGTNPLSIGAAGKYRFLSAGEYVRVSAGVTIKGTLLWNDTADSLTNFSGFSLGVPFLVSFGPAGFVLTPEVTISGAQVVYSTDSAGTGTPPYIWGYGRAALFTDLGSVTVASSVAVRTAPFSEGFKIHLPAALGAEVHLLIPGTQLVASFALGMEISSGSNYYVMAGGGLGFIY